MTLMLTMMTMSEDPVVEKFKALTEEHYPGSKQKRREPAKKAEKRREEERWDKNPRKLKVNGEDHEFFGIGALAKALNRKPVTIKMWETKGYIPLARFRTAVEGGKGHRLYTRRQIEGLQEIAREEGLLINDRRRSPGDTAFPARAEKLWEESGL